MTITAYDVAFVFSEIFTVYSIKMFYDLFFQIKSGFKAVAITAYASYAIITTLLHFVANIPFVNLVINIIILFAITLCYNSKLSKRIIAVSECYLIMFSSELIISVMTKSSFIEPFRIYEYENIIGLFLSRMMVFFVALLASRILDMRKNSELPLGLCLSSLAVPILTVLIELLFITTNDVTKNLVVTSMILLFFINMVVIFLFNSLSKFYDRLVFAKTIEQEREYLKNQCSLMQEATQDIRSFQHDISNHFMIIENMMKNKNEKEALSYLINLIKSEKSIQDVFCDTGNVSVDSIINFKLSKSSLRNINITTDIIIPNELPIEMIDLATILMNLLDNAIQALQKIEENRFLNIKIRYKKGMVLECVNIKK